MTIITKEINIAMGHSVTNHNSRCKNIHGHDYRIEVTVGGEIITTPGASDEGMIIDFKDVKEVMLQELDLVFDHGFVLWKEDPRASVFAMWRNEGQKVILVDFIPTAENLAKHWFNLLKSALEKRRVQLKQIKVWETPSSTATYSE